MRWEDLIERPEATISAIAAHCGLPVDAEHASQIWSRLDHVNLTGAHKHNLRRGKGIVGDWRNWITNRHLDIIREHGLETTMQRFGYGRIDPLDETSYTPFQRQVADLLARGEIYRDIPDPDLFGFAFNKSNLESSAFPFKRYPWRTYTQVERSEFTDEGVVMAVWDAAEVAVGELNAILDTVGTGNYGTEDEARRSAAAILDAARPVAKRMPKASEAFAASVTRTIAKAFARHGGDTGIADPDEPPRLVRSIGETNLVAYGGKFIAVPWAAGPLDLTAVPVETIPGARIADSYADLVGQVRSNS